MRLVCFFPVGAFLLLAPFAVAADAANEEAGHALAAPAKGGETVAGIALGDGERLVFQARWKLFSRVGRITVAADDVPASNAAGPAGEVGEAGGGAPLANAVVTAEAAADTAALVGVGTTAPAAMRRIRVDVSSDGVISHLYTYRATGESMFDPVSGRMLSATYQAEAGKRREDRSIQFDLENGIAHYRDALAPRRNADIPIPEGEPLDLITCLVTARRWNLKAGDTRDIVVLADKRFYPLRLRAEKRESIKVALGTFDALLIVPEPIGTPRGVFRKGGGMQIWIEDSPRALPLRVQVMAPVGMVNVDLVQYDAPLALRGKPGGESLRVRN